MTEHRAGRGIFDVIITAARGRYLIKSGLVGPTFLRAKAFFADQRTARSMGRCLSA